MSPKGKSADSSLVVVERGELEQMFGRLETPTHWLRVRQRVFHINSLGRPYGVRLAVNWRHRIVQVYYPSISSLTRLVSLLMEKPGSLQTAFALCLQKKVPAVAGSSVQISRLVENQTNHLKAILSKDLGIFGSADLNQVLVSATSGSNAGLKWSPFAVAVSKLPANVLILGETGSGKTTILYHVLRSWTQLSERLKGYLPLYVSAKHLRLDWDQPTIPWHTLPGVEHGLAPVLEEAFSSGRLCLLIDGVNENPFSTDFSNPAVYSFWQTASRNICILTALPQFYETHIKVSPLEALFQQKGLAKLPLGPWGANQYKVLFENLSRASRAAGTSELGMLAGYLNKLSVDQWQRESNLLRFTPLTGLACANFYASHKGMRLPKNEYDLLEHMTWYHLRHEGFKGTSPLVMEAAMGFLMRLAWEAYVQGHAGQWYCIPVDMALKLFKEQYPILESRAPEILSSISRIPHLEYSPANGVLFMNPHFADFLVARQALHTFLAADYTRIKEVFSIPWHYLHMSRSFFQGIRCLTNEQKRQYFQTSENLFHIYWQEYLKAPDFKKGVQLAYILQPLGFLEMQEAEDLLRKARSLAEEAGAEFVIMSATVGLAWGGNQEALEWYIERLHKSKQASSFNLSFYLFYKRQDRMRLDIENFSPELVTRWDRTCDWLLEATLRKDWDFYPLRTLYVFSLCNFLRQMGPGPFQPIGTNGDAEDEAMRRRGALSKVLSSWETDTLMETSRVVRREVENLASLAGKFKLLGGRNDAKKKAPKERTPLSREAAVA